MLAVASITAAGEPRSFGLVTLRGLGGEVVRHRRDTVGWPGGEFG